MVPSSRSRSTSGCTKWPRPPSTRAAPTVGLTRRRWALVGLLASAHLACAATPREAADYLAGSDTTALEALAAGADVVATAESRPGKGPYACRASALVQEVWAAGGLPSLYSAGAWYFIGGVPRSSAEPSEPSGASSSKKTARLALLSSSKSYDLLTNPGRKAGGGLPPRVGLLRADYHWLPQHKRMLAFPSPAGRAVSAFSRVCGRAGPRVTSRSVPCRSLPTRIQC